MVEKTSDNIAEISLNRYLRITDSSLKKHVRQGEKDGNNNVPATTQEEFSPYELTLIQSAKSAWARYGSALSQRRKSIQREIDNQSRMLDEGLDEKRTQLMEEKGAALATLDKKFGPGSPAIVELESYDTECKTKLNRLELRLGRGLDVKMLKVYLPFLIFLALVEIPVNQMAFTLFFDEGAIITSLLALAVGTIFIYFSHVIGTGLKRTTCKECDVPVTKTYIIMGALAIFSILIMYVLAKMRQAVISLTSSSQGFDVNAFLEGGVTMTVETVGSTSLAFEGFTLLVLNIAIFAAGLVSAFYRHDAHPEYEHLYFEHKKIKRELLKKKTQFVHDQAELAKQHDKKIDFIDKERHATNEGILKSSSDLVALEEQKDKDFKIVIAALAQEILSYQSGNTSKRIDSAPSYFGKSGLSNLSSEVLD